MITTQIPNLYISKNPKKGRCIYTATPITSGSLVEICPVIILTTKETLVIHETLLHDYYFLWDAEKKTSAIALGYGSLYNHDNRPNAEFTLVKEDEEIHIHAIRDIEAGEEITLNYIASKEEGYDLWFEQ